MKLHLIIDFSFLYYKYKNKLERGSMPHLTAQASEYWGIDGIEPGDIFDISEVYYSIREIEGFRKNLDGNYDVTISICFDSKSDRKSEDSEYKANRKSSLVDSDFAKIQLTKRILTMVGYNVYQIEGCEADDLVYSLVQMYKNQFDATYIYTPDLDLFVNIDKQCKVGVYRYKWTTGYMGVNVNNFTAYTSAELKCHIPFNCILLYKATVGDKSDNIKGIQGFGPKAFDKLIQSYPLDSTGYAEMVDSNNVKQYILKYLPQFFSEEKVEQAIQSLYQVTPIKIEGLPRLLIGGTSKEKRNQVYSELSMLSLLED